MCSTCGMCVCLQVEAMLDHTLSWGPAERAEADNLPSTVAQLLAPVAKHLNLQQPSWQALRSRMKVRQSAHW